MVGGINYLCRPWREGFLGLFILHWMAVFMRWSANGAWLPPGLRGPSGNDVRVIIVGEETSLYDSVVMYHHARLLAWEKRVPLRRLFILCKAELRWLLWWVPGLVFVDRSKAGGVVRGLIRDTSNEAVACIVGIFPAGRRAFVEVGKWRSGAETVWRESKLNAVSLGIDWERRESRLVAVRPSRDPYYKTHALYPAVARDLKPFVPAFNERTPIASM